MIKQYVFLIYILLFHYIFSSPCLENENFCIKCNQLTGLCLKCKSDILIPDDNGGCIGIENCFLGNNYCEKCNENGKLCQICEQNYYPDENGGCSITSNCKISDKGECFQCKEGYFLVHNTKSCKSLSSSDLKNCKIINETNGLCDVCDEGFYLNNGDKRCITTDNCFSSSFGVCTSCNEGYYLNKKNDKCIKQEKPFLHCKETIDNEKCDKCDENYFFSEDGNCVSTNFCLKSIENICTECIDNYYLTKKSNICSYDKNCVDADRYTGFCNLCSDYFYLDKKDGKCKSNRENNEFKYCIIAGDICTACEKDYYLGQDNLCSSTKNCSESDNGLCLTCNEGYYLGLDHKCTIYKNCIYSDYYYECIECDEGYYFDRLNESCRISIDRFEHCKHSNQFGGYCEACKDGYYLIIRNKTCKSNEEEGLYYKCEVTDYYDDCYKCIKDYYLSTGDKRCTKVDGCKFSKNENECYECEHDHCLNMKNLTCIWNDVITEEYEKIYYKCNYTNIEGTKCEICDDNYTLTDEGLCLNLFDCEILKDENCEQCKRENIYGMNLCLNKDLGCVETFTEGCKRCDDIENFYDCTECYDGYKLNEYSGCELIESDN